MKLPSRTVPDLASQLNFQKLEQTVDSAPVTSLPTTDLYVGRRIVYVADATNGVHWDLVFDGVGSYPWKYVGGPELYAEVEADEGTGSTAYVDLATVGPSVALPLAGDYMVSHGFNGYNTNASNQDMNMSYAIGGAAAVNADAVEPFVPASTAPGRGNWARTRRKPGLAAVTLTAKYRVSGGANGQFFDRWLSAKPIRVG